MAGPCGCHLYNDEYANNIVPCPKHAEVDNMLAALEAEGHKSDGLYCLTKVTPDRIRFRVDCRGCQALAAAQGGAA